MYSSASWSSSSSSETRLHHQLPRGHTYLDTLRHVSFGTVVMCKRRDAGQIVDVKTSDHHQDLHQEASMLRHLMLHNLDKCNILTLYDEIFVSNRMSLVVEMFDISLHDYLLETQGLVLLEDIRTVIQQMATALAALKRVGVIHGDVTTDNIMMVDRVRQPFRVKLIDFSQAMFSSQAKPGRILQTPQYRAAEIMLGLPFCEAVDIWALGCVMGIMMFGFELFPTTTDYDALLFIIDLLGPPPQHLMKAAQKSKVCFKKTDCGQWRLKTPEEYWGPDLSSHDDRKYTFRSLDEGKMLCLEQDNVTEADERRECMELLKEMVAWDERERITPADVLNHPFITKSYIHSTSRLSSCPQPAAALDATSIHMDNTELPPNTSDDEEEEEEGGRRRRRSSYYYYYYNNNINNNNNYY